MYTYKYYVETDNEVKPVYDLEFTVRYKKFEAQMEVIDEQVTSITNLETNKKENMFTREVMTNMFSKYFKSWDELEAELWSDWDDKQIFD